MLDWGVAADFQDIVKSNQVALDIDILMVNAVAHARLSSQVDYDRRLILGIKI